MPNYRLHGVVYYSLLQMLLKIVIENQNIQREQMHPFEIVLNPTKIGFNMRLVARKLDFDACKKQWHSPDCASPWSDQCLFIRILESTVAKLAQCKI